MQIKLRNENLVRFRLSLRFHANNATKPKTPPTAMLKSLSAFLTAAPVKVAIPGLVVCGCTPGGSVPVADTVPDRNGALAPDLVGATKLPVGGGPGAAGTRPTLVLGVAGGGTAPGGPLVNGAGGGVAVTNETCGTVTAVVITIMVEAEEMVCVYEIVVTGPGTGTLLVTGGAETMDVITVPD